VCREEFTRIPRQDGTLPPACKEHVRVYLGRQRRGLFTAAMQRGIATKKAQARQQLKQRLQQEFGAITDREAALFAKGVSVGYKRGFDTGYYRHGRQVKAS
jgi:hypothetical protein